MSPFDDVLCARIPMGAVRLLAALRCEPGLRIAVAPPHMWLRWDAGSERVIESVLPIHGSVLFRFHDGRWHRFGASLPDFAFPADLDFQPLAHVLFPAPVQPIPVNATALQPMRLSLVGDDRPRAAAAIVCPLAALTLWSDTVPAARLAALRGACLEHRVLVLGPRLPILPDTRRLWGHHVLMPLGFVPSPNLPESALLDAAGASADELVLWLPECVEVLPRALLTPLSRASLRLAAREARR